MNPKISVLITAWKEEQSIGKAIECIGNDEYSGIGDSFEILLAAPDIPTRDAAIKKSIEIGIQNKLRILDDKGGGKNKGLNLLISEAKGDIWLFTDGDVWYDRNAVRELVRKFENHDKSKILLVTGRPVSADKKDTMMGYFGNLLADAAHHKRKISLSEDPAGKSMKFVSREPFFPVSGYIYAVSNLQEFEFKFPEDTLVDDAYISYWVYNNGGKIKYAPDAMVFVKYPTNLSDYFKQKKRSAGGYVQLWKYGIVKPETVTRSFKKEIQYFWFPIKYARNLKQFFWSLMIYPIRFIQWMMIFWEQKVRKKSFEKTWVRIESTK
jgi:cellulose synthase/poly-beta-1,6-N-acetylglucosamine synthase-like glycosyltransferase